MLQNKSNSFFSEITNFFNSSSKAILTLTNIYKFLKLEKLNFGIKDFSQAKSHKSDIFLALLLFPILQIKNVHSYIGTELEKIFTVNKNTFYRFKNNSNIRWRSILYSINKKLFKKIEENKTNSEPKDKPRCLVVDDSDLPKTGLKFEHIGKVWSHVKHRMTIGFKGLFLGYWDGTSFFGLDFSLHNEKGRNKNKPYGLRRKDIKARYNKKRERNSQGFIREKELGVSKIKNALKMIKRAVKRNISVDYLLMDSWFVCDSILKYVQKTSFDLIGMFKMGNALFDFGLKKMAPKKIIKVLQKQKKVKYRKEIGMYVAQTEATYKGTELKLYFCKTSKRAKWHLLVSTDKTLGVIQAYKTYSIRWTIEVFFKESKQYFNLGKSQSNDFDGQIADITIAMINYNIFSIIKKMTDYQTIGGIFKDSSAQLIELTIAQRMWKFIIELIEVVATITNSDFNELIISIMKNSDKHNKIINLINSSYAEVI